MPGRATDTRSNREPDPPPPVTDPRSPSEELPSYCKSLFSGVIAADLAFPYPGLAPDEADEMADYLSDL